MKRIITVDVDGAWRNASQVVAAGIWVEGFGRWVRLWFDYGEAPGSHMWFWRTDCGPREVHGWNFRVCFGGWPRNCLTLLAHTRPSRKQD